MGRLWLESVSLVELARQCRDLRAAGATAAAGAMPRCRKILHFRLAASALTRFCLGDASVGRRNLKNLSFIKKVCNDTGKLREVQSRRPHYPRLTL
jgi:hypothetical protein